MRRTVDWALERAHTSTGQQVLAGLCKTFQLKHLDLSSGTLYHRLLKGALVCIIGRGDVAQYTRAEQLLAALYCACVGSSYHDEAFAPEITKTFVDTIIALKSVVVVSNIQRGSPNQIVQCYAIIKQTFAGVNKQWFPDQAVLAAVHDELAAAINQRKKFLVRAMTEKNLTRSALHALRDPPTTTTTTTTAHTHTHTHNHQHRRTRARARTH